MNILKIVILCLGCFGSLDFANSKVIIECNNITRFVREYTEFLKIIPQKMLPVARFCSNNTSIDYYMEATKAFEKAVHDRTCHFHINRLNIIQKLYDQMNSIWQEAHCQNCVDNLNRTNEFHFLTDQLNACIATYPLNPCDPCASNYSSVQNLYAGLKKYSGDQLCFDIEDQMNLTRHDWSAKYNCCKDKKHSQQYFIVFASVFSCLPVLFYVAMYWITLRKEAREEVARVPLLDDSLGSNVTANATMRNSTNIDELIVDNGEICHERAGPSSKHSTHSEDSEFHDKCETKLNNLDSTKLREGNLIDVDSKEGGLESSFEYNIDKKRSSPALDDDVSLLGASSDNKIGDLLN
ncbi:uncharacterized protein LOC131425722 [Malaya genurostris]|uniref:uncharacterized protein LOC131425722 n=1 Tax=Malaya genurostris TaxID=325434 RepID=UPI0026F3B491|nr:uncharacterized protein LOC131425722 [Malaya genurostris]